MRNSIVVTIATKIFSFWLIPLVWHCLYIWVFCFFLFVSIFRGLMPFRKFLLVRIPIIVEFPGFKAEFRTKFNKKWPNIALFNAYSTSIPHLYNQCMGASTAYAMYVDSMRRSHLSTHRNLLRNTMLHPSCHVHMQCSAHWTNVIGNHQWKPIISVIHIHTRVRYVATCHAPPNVVWHWKRSGSIAVQ